MNPIYHKDINEALTTTRGDKIPVVVEDLWGTIVYKLTWKERLSCLFKGRLWYSVYCKRPTPVFVLQVRDFQRPVKILIIEECSHSRLVCIQSLEGFVFYCTQEKLQGEWVMVHGSDSISLYKAHDMFCEFILDKEQEADCYLDVSSEILSEPICEN